MSLSGNEKSHRSIKPFKALIFLLGVLLLLFAVSLFFPEDGARIGKRYTLRFPSAVEFFEKDTLFYPDISSIISSYPVSGEQEKTDNYPGTGSVIAESEPAVFNYDSTLRLIQALELPEGHDSTLYAFFRKLQNLNENRKVIRILHYGDSQIETDRITSYIRFQLHKEFGGSGCGLFPVVPLYGGVPSISQDYASVWKRHTGFVTRDTSAGHKRYGALFTFSRYNGDVNAGKDQEAWVRFSPSSAGYSSAGKFLRIGLFASAYVDSLELSLIVDDSLIHQGVLPPDEHLTNIQWELKDTPSDVRMLVSGKGVLDVFSLSADGKWGVAVDNIPLRGSSGLEFSKTDTLFLKEMYSLMNIGMLILQFGGNIVPQMSDNYDFYERFFKRELSLLKRILPGVPVIVIGPSDMSVKIKDKYVTYPSLPKVRDAMRNAAFGCGYVFWDMYEAMGGENSMPGWVFADPPLAVPDFVHFNRRGARLIAGMLYDAIIWEYNQWKYSAHNN